MKLNQLMPLFVLAVVFSCSTDKDPSPKMAKYATLSIVSGDGQTGMRSRELEDSLVMQVATDHKALSLRKFYIRATVIEGNGSVISNQSGLPGISEPNSKGRFKVRWKLGCDVKQQSVRFDLFYMDSCNFMSGVPANCTAVDSVTFSADATAELSSGWTKICGMDWTDAHHTTIREFGNEIYAVNLGTLYRLNDGESKSWEELPNVPDDVHDFGFDSNGRLYILTESSGIFVTDNQKHWTPYGTDILQPSYPLALLVEDSVVYASFMFDGIYRIRKNSSFARKLLVDGRSYDEYSFPVRHPNGDLYIVDKWDTYWKSSNSGDSWTSLSIEWKYVNYETRDFKIHPAGLLYIGSGDASLAILSPTTYTGELHRYYEWNSSSQHIENIVFDGEDVYYLVCHTPDPGIYSSLTGWRKIDLDFDQRISLFHRKKDGSFLLGSTDGVYYRAN